MSCQIVSPQQGSNINSDRATFIISLGCGHEVFLELELNNIIVYNSGIMFDTRRRSVLLEAQLPRNTYGQLVAKLYDTQGNLLDQKFYIYQHLIFPNFFEVIGQISQVMVFFSLIKSLTEW